MRPRPLAHSRALFCQLSVSTCINRKRASGAAIWFDAVQVINRDPLKLGRNGLGSGPVLGLTPPSPGLRSLRSSANPIKPKKKRALQRYPTEPPSLVLPESCYRREATGSHFSSRAPGNTWAPDRRRCSSSLLTTLELTPSRVSPLRPSPWAEREQPGPPTSDSY